MLRVQLGIDKFENNGFNRAVSDGHRDGSDHDLMGYLVFPYISRLGAKRDVAPVATHGSAVK
jgi:hypothetical protein